MIKFRVLAILLVGVFIQTTIAQTDSFLLRLKGLPDVIDVTSVKPNGKHFHQRVFLSHSNFSKPKVFVTEGCQADYAQSPYYSEELTRMI